MARPKEQGAVIDLNLGDLFQRLEATSERVAKEEAKRATERAKKKRRGGGGKKRVRGEETPLTAKLVYRVLDKTTGTVHIAVGLGTTEALVDDLLGQEHDLTWFKQSKSGASMKNARPYQCILDNRGRSGNYRYAWRPTEEYGECALHDEAQLYTLVTVTPHPYYLGGVRFELKEMTDDEDKPLDRYDRVTLGATLEEETRYLDGLKAAGAVVAQEVVDPEIWVRGMCEVAGATPTKATTEQFKAYLRDNLIPWPPTPAQMSIIRLGGTLRLDPKLDLPDKETPTIKVVDREGRLGPIQPVPRKYVPEWGGGKEYRVYGYGGTAEKTLLTSGSLEHCQAFLAQDGLQEALLVGGFKWAELTREWVESP